MGQRLSSASAAGPDSRYGSPLCIPLLSPVLQTPQAVMPAMQQLLRPVPGCPVSADGPPLDRIANRIMRHITGQIMRHIRFVEY